MRRLVIPDSGPLGQIINPKINPRVEAWLEFLKEQKISLQIVEICDYEVRRNCILQAKVSGLEQTIKNINKLDKYRQTKRFLPITSEVMLDAADLWAEVRQKGQPTADDKSIDGDVILIAQAISQLELFEQVIVATTNSKHLVRFCEYGIYIWDWKQALVDCIYKEINFYQTELKDLL